MKMSDELWANVAKRVTDTVKQVEARDYSESLIHLATVYGVLSIAYYKDDKSWVSDGAYDDLCKHLLANYDEAMAMGTYGTILQKDALEAGTGYHLANEGTLPYSAQTLHDIYRKLDLPEYKAPAVRKRARPTASVPKVRKRQRPSKPVEVRKRKRPGT